MATAAVAEKKDGLEAPRPRPFDQRRLQTAAVTMGEMLHLTLPDAEKLTEGLQDVARWVPVAEHLHMGQWIIVENDAGSWWCSARIELVHGGAGMGLRGLSLRWVTPPYEADKAVEAVQATGEFYVRWLGQWRKWAVINPKGEVAAEGINTEAAARVRLTEVMRNARVYTR